MDRGAWWARVHGVTKRQMTEQTHIFFLGGRGRRTPPNCGSAEVGLALGVSRNLHKPSGWLMAQ